MSNELRDEVYRRETGNLARTAVLTRMADRASGDGSGIWPSKQRLAEEIGATKQTVITAIKSLIADGLIHEVGQVPCTNGFTVDYAINVTALHALPLTKSAQKDEQHRSRNLTGQASSPVQTTHPTGQNTLPDGSENLTPPVKEFDPNPHLTLIEPSKNAHPQKPPHRKSQVKVLMTDDWQPQPLPEDLINLVNLWPVDREQRELREFREYWIEKGERRPGWDRTWRAWIGRQHDRIIRDNQGGYRREVPPVDSSSATDAFLFQRELYRARRKAVS